MAKKDEEPIEDEPEDEPEEEESGKDFDFGGDGGSSGGRITDNKVLVGAIIGFIILTLVIIFAYVKFF
jgi:hypothetical protein